MIEKRIKNQLTLKRYKRFKNNKFAYYSVFAFLIFNFFSFTAEFWANSKPLVMGYQGKVLFPVLIDYHPKDFGIDSQLIMDYRSIQNEEGSWSVWPLVEWDPFEKNDNVDQYPSPPSFVNLMGTDDRGRDVFTRLLYGLRYGMIYAVCVWFISFIVGTLLGGLMGYFGGWFDLITQRVIEVLSTTPQFFLLLIIISIFQPSLFWLILISVLFGWISISYYARAEFLRLRKREFVEAARGIGVPTWKIIVKHILPNALTPIVTFSPFVIASSITGLASLDFLGFGLEIPTPSWGELLAQAQKYVTTAWWLTTFPSIYLFATLTLLINIGDGVRDAFDPYKTLD